MDFNMMDDGHNGFESWFAKLTKIKTLVQKRKDWKESNKCAARDEIAALDDLTILNSLVAEKLFGWSFSEKLLHVGFHHPDWGTETNWLDKRGLPAALPPYADDSRDSFEIVCFLEKRNAFFEVGFEDGQITLKSPLFPNCIRAKKLSEALCKLALIANLD